MSEVIEQGATRRFRPSDFKDVPLLDFEKPGGPGYKPSRPGIGRPDIGRRKRPFPPSPDKVDPKYIPSWPPKKAVAQASVPRAVSRAAFAATGRALPRLARFHPYIRGLSLALDLADMAGIDLSAHVSKLWKRDPNTGVCTAPMNAPRRDDGYRASYICDQFLSGTLQTWAEVSGNLQWYYVERKTGSFGIPVAYSRVKYTRAVGAPAGPLPYRSLLPGYYNPWLNPNVQRLLPTLAVAPVVPELAVQTKTDTKTQPSPRLQSPRNGRSIGGTIRPVSPRRRVPPRRREKEGKFMSRSQKIMIGFFKAMDKISESAEIVDAFYEALPKETRKKWDCGRNHFGIDTAGQYGLENADCKAKALYHNWHKVDFDIAVENVIKNALEDKILGAIHQRLPNNTGSALDPSFKEFGEHLQDALDELVQIKTRENNPWLRS